MEQWMKRVAIGLVGLSMGLASACGTAADTSVPPTTTASTAPPTTAVTKDAFLQQGNAICADGNEQMRAVTATLPGGKPATMSDLAAWMRANSKVVGGSVSKLRALPQPAADAAELTAMYAEADQLIDLSNQMAAAAEQANQAEVSRLSAEGDVLQPKANARLNAYGLTECGKTT
jgi:hypothetical protein